MTGGETPQAQKDPSTNAGFVINRFSLGAFLLVAVLLHACATGSSMSGSDIEAVPPGLARVVVYSTEILGTAVQPRVSIDGRETGRCRPKGAFFIDVEPGRHTLSATTDTTASTTLDVAPGETAYIECTIHVGVLVGEPKLTPVRAETGRNATSDLPLTGRY